MQAAVELAQVVDGHNLLAVDLTEKDDAAIDRLVDEPPVAHRPEGHCTCAAVALSAALLGAACEFPETQVVEQRRHRRDVRQLDDLATAQESNRLAHCHQLPR